MGELDPKELGGSASSIYSLLGSGICRSSSFRRCKIVIWGEEGEKELKERKERRKRKKWERKDNRNNIGFLLWALDSLVLLKRDFNSKLYTPNISGRFLLCNIADLWKIALSFCRTGARNVEMMQILGLPWWSLWPRQDAVMKELEWRQYSSQRGAQSGNSPAWQSEAEARQEGGAELPMPQRWRITCHMVTIFSESKIGRDDLTQGRSMGQNIWNQGCPRKPRTYGRHNLSLLCKAGHGLIHRVTKARMQAGNSH